MILFPAAARTAASLLKLLACLTLVLCSALPLQALATPASGYWWNTVEPGRGFVIEIQGGQMFMAGFLYAANGEATWVASSGAMSTSTQYSGPLVTYSGGQTLTGSFQPATQNPVPLGNIAISFSDDSHGSVTWPGGTIPIQRFDFGPGGAAAAQAATNPENGWWWNPNEGGRGFAIEVQGGTMYFAGYMYDSTGNPTWYLASGAMGNPAVFQGEWTQFANGETLTGAFQTASVVNPMVGSVTLQFNNAYSATLTLPNARQIPLARYGFGVTAPVLTGFSPAAATPESLLTINGTGFDPTGTVTVTLSDSLGYSVTVPAASVSATSISVSVPPYIVPASSAFGSGPVQLQATQKSQGVSLTTNTLADFTIQPLPAAKGTPGSSTLALIVANLSEAQKLQTSINGTPQATPAVAAALAQQVTNLQSLVTNVQSVVQNGLSYTLGTIGGVNVSVTPANIGDVDSLILATLQSLTNPAAGSTAGSAAKSAQAVNPTCLSAEASAFAAAMTSGSGNLQQLAQNLLEAPQSSAACGTATAFTSAYQIFGGAVDVGLGIAEGSGGGVVGARLPGAALFAATTEDSSTAVGLNALISPALASQATSVQSTIAHVQALADPTTNLLLAKSTGALATSLTGAQGIIDQVAPPPAASASIAGTVANSGAMANAAVTVTDGNGKTATATAAADGTYSVSVTGLSAPVFLLATDPAGLNGPVVSVAATLPSSGSATVNITPLTTAVAALLTGDGYVYGITAANVSAMVTPNGVANAVAILNQALSPILAANGLSVSTSNPISTPLIVNDTGYDAVASAVNLLPAGAGLQLVATANPNLTLVLNGSTTVPTTPLSVPPVASNYLDFMQTELQKCLAVSLANRSTDPTCSGLTDSSFLANGYTTMPTAYPDFALASSVGATFVRPKTLLFFTDTSNYQLALVRFKYTLADGTPGRVVTVVRQVPSGTTPTTLPDGTVATWTLYGNQGSYDASVVSRAYRLNFFDAADVSYYSFGLGLIFNPSGPNAAPVNAVNVTGPGLPSGGAWLFRSSACGTADYMTISGTVHTGPPTSGTQSFTTSTTTGFKWSWAAQVPGTTFTPPANQQWSASPVNASGIPFASIYTFQLYNESGQAITSFTRRNVSPAVDANYIPAGNWPTLSPSVADAFITPTGSQAGTTPSVAVNWTNSPLGLPAYQVEAGSGPDTGSTPVAIDGFGVPKGTASSVNIAAGVSNSGEITSVCSGSQFSPLTAGAYRFIEIQTRDPSDVQVFDETQYND